MRAFFLLFDPMWTIVQTCSVKTDKGKGGGAPKASATTKTTSGTTMSGGGKAAGGGPATARSSLQSPSHAPDTTPRCVSQSVQVELPSSMLGMALMRLKEFASRAAVVRVCLVQGQWHANEGRHHGITSLRGRQDTEGRLAHTQQGQGQGTPHTKT